VLQFVKQAVVGPLTAPARNVIVGWLGVPVPRIPKQRNKSRAAYRKTTRKRGVAPVPASRQAGS
jgi:hypothetical protein